MLKGEDEEEFKKKHEDYAKLVNSFKKQETKKQETEKQETKKQETEKQETKKQETEKQETKKQETEAWLPETVWDEYGPYNSNDPQNSALSLDINNDITNTFINLIMRLREKPWARKIPSSGDLFSPIVIWTPLPNQGLSFGISKKQQGGQLNMNEQELQQAFLQYLAQQTGAKTQQELEQVIQKMGEEGLKQAYAQFVQAMQQLQVQAAKFGAKLNYIKQLNGHCPEGTEMKYYKVGGRICKKCVKALEGAKAQGDAIQQFKSVESHKCGKKIKKSDDGSKLGKGKYPLIYTDKDGKNKTRYYSDEATRDSILANRYNDQDIQVNRPGSYKKNAKGLLQWTPDRTKAPYKKK